MFLEVFILTVLLETILAESPPKISVKFGNGTEIKIRPDMPYIRIIANDVQNPVQLLCKATYRIEWRKEIEDQNDGSVRFVREPYQALDVQGVSTTTATATLTFSPLTESHSTKYVCQSQKFVGNYNKASLDLVVISPSTISEKDRNPPEIQFKFADGTVLQFKQNSSVQITTDISVPVELTCFAEYPVNLFQATKYLVKTDDLESDAGLLHKRGYSGEIKSFMTITFMKLTRSNSGKYHCAPHSSFAAPGLFINLHVYISKPEELSSNASINGKRCRDSMFTFLVLPLFLYHLRNWQSY